MSPSAGAARARTEREASRGYGMKIFAVQPPRHPRRELVLALGLHPFDHCFAFPSPRPPGCAAFCAGVDRRKWTRIHGSLSAADQCASDALFAKPDPPYITQLRRSSQLSKAAAPYKGEAFAPFPSVLAWA
jgi:hypothetical protein